MTRVTFIYNTINNDGIVWTHSMDAFITSVQKWIFAAWYSCLHAFLR